MSRLDWDKARLDNSRARRRAERSSERRLPEDRGKAPTVRQLNYLRRLAEERGRTFETPRTAYQASVQINLLLAAPKR